MKKWSKVFGIVAFVAIIGFTTVSCDNPSGDSGGGGGNGGGGNGHDSGEGPGQVSPGPDLAATPVPITITITGIPSKYHNSWGELLLRHPETWDFAGAGRREVSVIGTSTTVAFYAAPGAYNLLLRFGSYYGYFIASRNITAGANVIPLSAFTPFEEVSITLTGIPNRYIGYGVYVHLKRPGTLNRISYCFNGISSSSVTLMIPAIPGVYDVHLRFWDGWDGILLRAYSAPSVNIAVGENTIPFTAFDIFEPTTITVTGIPSLYFGAGGAMGLHTPGFTDWIIERDFEYTEASLTLTIFVMPGIYDVSLDFWGLEDEDEWLFYLVSRRDITAGANTIPFSAFSRVPQMTITVTGIPARYIGNGNWVGANVRLAPPGTESWLASGWASSRGSSVTMSLMTSLWVFNTPGTYDVHLRFEWSGGESFYIAPSRNITAGNTTIPFGDFTPLERSGRINNCAETLESPERAMRDRSRTRAHSLRAR